MASLRIPDKFKPVLGTVLCGMLAVTVSVMGQSKPGKSALPIWFLAVVMGTVFLFGSLAGVLGTILSGTIFATYLFEPFGRLAIHNAVQKDNLMWMVLVGLALSMFGHRQDNKTVSPNKTTQK